VEYRWVRGFDEAHDQTDDRRDDRSTLAIAGYHMVASGLFNVALVMWVGKNSESDTTAAINTAFDPIWDAADICWSHRWTGSGGLRYMHNYGVTEKDAARVVVRIVRMLVEILMLICGKK